MAVTDSFPNPKIRLLFAIDSVAFDGGTEKQLGELLVGFDRDRFVPHLFCMEDSLRLRELRRSCATVVSGASRITSPRVLLAIWRLRGYLRRYQIDLVQTFGFKEAVVAVLAARWARCPVVVTSRRDLGYWHTRAYLRAIRLLNCFTTRILANSEAVKSHTVHTEHVSSEKVDVIYNGVDLDRYSAGNGDPSVAASIGIPPASPVVGVVANLRPVKNLPLFLHAAARVTEVVPEACFLIVGLGPLRSELGRLAEQLGLAGNVFFSDGRGEVQDYLARMCIGCLPSRSEGFSNAVLEYMAAGLPVVASDVGGTAEAVEHGATGYLVRTPDPSSFAAPIIELLQDDTKRIAMGRRSLDRCRQRFSMATTIRAHEDYYASLLARSLS